MTSSALKVHTVKSIPAAFNTLVKLGENWATADPPCFWFRGSSSNLFSLLPGAYWRKNYSERDPLIDFARGGLVYSPIGSVDDWSTYYLAQHHGIPTRLMDWTESFAAAIFFAFDGWKGRTTPCVWILQPYAFNDAFVDLHGLIEPEDMECTRGWLPCQVDRPDHITARDEDGTLYDNEFPMAIFPRISNQRLAAQQGVFTVHGRIRKPLPEIMAERGHNAREVITRIDFSEIRKPTARQHLAALGLKRNTIYPDIDNFVKQLKETYGWLQPLASRRDVLCPSDSTN